MFKLCEKLGYTPPPDVKPRDELACLAAERDELAQRCASLIKEQEELIKEQKELAQQLDRCAAELSEIVNSRTWKAIQITKKIFLLRVTGHLTLNLVQACKKVMTINNP